MNNSDLQLDITNKNYIFNDHEEKDIKQANEILDNIKNEQLFYSCTQSNQLLLLYYENLFMEILLLHCWSYIEKYSYTKHIFLTVDNLLLQLKIDLSHLCTVKIYILCPISNLRIFEKSTIRNNESITLELQKIVHHIYSHYENNNLFRNYNLHIK